MGSAERWWRDTAAHLRAEYPSAARPRTWLDQVAAESDAKADLLALYALEDGEFSDLFRPSAGDALALRGEG